MKLSNFLRSFVSLFIIFCLLSTPLLAGGGKKGEKNFKEGMKYEIAQQWDKAAEEFALALAANPGNAEYQLHYRRALFNASQMMMQRGRSLAEQKDYVGAYNAFRQAYGYDPVNELAKSEMERMLRLQQETENKNNPNKKLENETNVKLVPTSYKENPQQPQDLNPRVEQFRTIKYATGVDLQFLIKDLAKDLNLNVLFDSDSFRSPRTVKIELENVTASRALDYIFLQEGLFFQRVGPRTILVAPQTKRSQFQQLVLRTFYLANADPQEVGRTIQQAIPPQPGRTPTQVLTDKATNSLTVRDTEENIKLIAKLIKSLDKDRAEVVMDVNIYEVSKNDLLQIGNQIGSTSQLTNLGGVSNGIVGVAGSRRAITNAIKDVLPVAFGAGILVPTSTISALQTKGTGKLLASTQIHAFNGEKSTARIGQRVPVQTAQVFPFTGSNVGGTSGSAFGGSGFPVINFEQVGLTLEFEPLVFPNQDVQVKMKIESKDVVGASSLTPTFTERSIAGTARIQNNRTLLLASVAQGNESNNRSGLPLLGLIPILGRLFTAPNKESRQVDIVIAVTPRVLRSPEILPEDEETRETGTISSPTNNSLEAMIRREDMEEQLAMARNLPTNAVVQLPDQPVETPDYVKTPETNADSTKTTSTVTTSTVSNNATETTQSPVNPRPIDTSVKTLNITQTVDSTDKPDENPTPKTENPVTVQPTSLKIEQPKPTEETSDKQVTLPKAEIKFLTGTQPMKAGEKRRVAVMMKSASLFKLAVLSLLFNGEKLKVNRVVYGEVFGATMAQTAINPMMNSNGAIIVSLAPQGNVATNSNGILIYMDIEALADTVPAFTFQTDETNIVTDNGQSFEIQRQL